MNKNKTSPYEIISGGKLNKGKSPDARKLLSSGQEGELRPRNLSFNKEREKKPLYLVRDNLSLDKHRDYDEEEEGSSAPIHSLQTGKLRLNKSTLPGAYHQNSLRGDGNKNENNINKYNIIFIFYFVDKLYYLLKK